MNSVVTDGRCPSSDGAVVVKCSQYKRIFPQSLGDNQLKTSESNRVFIFLNLIERAIEQQDREQADDPEDDRSARAGRHPQVADVDDVVVVPAFAGLGAPYWDPDARGAIVGLSRGSGRDQIVTATLQAVAYQTLDLIRSMAEDGISPAVIRVDGGMVENSWFLQFLADVLNTPVERPVNVESTVLGAAYLAAIAAGVLQGSEQIADNWQCQSRFEPAMTSDHRERLLNGWRAAVSRVRTNE